MILANIKLFFWLSLYLIMYIYLLEQILFEDILSVWVNNSNIFDLIILYKNENSTVKVQAPQPDSESKDDTFKKKFLY